MTNIKATDPSNGHVPTGDKCKNSQKVGLNGTIDQKMD